MEPLFIQTARLHNVCIAGILWLTNSTVRPCLRDVLHLAQALLLELRIAHGQHLVHDEDFRFQVGGHGEGQAHVHAGGVAFDRGVDELLDFGEGDDLVELLRDLGLGHAEDGAVEEDVFAAGEFGVEAGADFEQAGDAALDA